MSILLSVMILAAPADKPEYVLLTIKVDHSPGMYSPPEQIMIFDTNGSFSLRSDVVFEARLFASIAKVLAYINSAGLSEYRILGCYRLDGTNKVRLKHETVTHTAEVVTHDNVWSVLK